jgi:hypothetical protein
MKIYMKYDLNIRNFGSCVSHMPTKYIIILLFVVMSYAKYIQRNHLLNYRQSTIDLFTIKGYNCES